MNQIGYSAAQVRAAEQPLLDAGVPLMERAAAGLAEVIREVVAQRSEQITPTVVLLVGPGNNGGDALFAGAELAAEGTDVAVVPVSSRVHDEAMAAAVTAGARVIESSAAAVLPVVQAATVVVDGMFGIGSAGSAALRGPARELVLALQPALTGPQRAVVIAVDIPSGIDADDGGVPDPAVLTADITVTFGAVKAGLLLEPARRYAGAVRLIDIGLTLDPGEDDSAGT